MQVLQDCFLHANGLIVSDSSWTSVEEIGSLLSAARSAEMPATPNDRPGTCAHEEEFDDAPWLLQVAGPTATGKVPGGLPERASRGSSGSHDVLAGEYCEVDIEQVVLELYARRAQLLDTAPTAEHFFVQARGGAWTQRTHGTVIDCFAAYARKGPPMDWSHAWGLGKSASFAISLYTESGAQLLATSWVHKLQWLYHVFLVHGDEPEWDFGPSVLGEYVEPEGIAEFCSTAPPAFRNRAAGLRA